MISRRDFVKSASLAAAAPLSLAQAPAPQRAPAVMRTVRPVVISDYSGWEFKNGGAENAVQRAFRLITEGQDVLDALIAGVNIPELDPLETGIGYGALPNANGVIELDASCMHGPEEARGRGGVPRRRAHAVAGGQGRDGVHRPSPAGRRRRAAVRAQHGIHRRGRPQHRDLAALWREWKRRVDPEHWLDPNGNERKPKPKHEKDPGDEAAWQARAMAAGRSMVRDGLIPEGSFWGTINCDGLGPNGDICGVTTTSGLAWKIPGRTGDSPILGAGLYVDNEVGAAGSTGRGEANLYNLSSFLIVESMRRGMSPKDAGMEALKRIKANTIESRLLNAKGNPNFNIRFFALNKQGEYAGVAMYRAGETKFAVCTENGAQALELEPLLPGTPED